MKMKLVRLYIRDNYTVNLLTVIAVGFPIDQRFTFSSSPPVMKFLRVFFPIFKQFTFAEWATNSSMFSLVKEIAKTEYKEQTFNHHWTYSFTFKPILD